MSIPLTMLPTTCDVYRPFGSATPAATAVPCRLVPDLATGRLYASLVWTHYAEFDAAADVRDGTTRPLGELSVSYADGDEVRIPSGGGTRFVVVWTETIDLGTPRAYKRAYLLRHTA